jgi:hypothetical protein
MIMIRHQAVRLHPQPEPLHRFGQRLDEPLSVPLIEENLPPFIASGHDVIDGSRKLHSNRSGHAPTLTTSNSKCQKSIPLKNPVILATMEFFGHRICLAHPRSWHRRDFRSQEFCQEFLLEVFQRNHDSIFHALSRLPGSAGCRPPPGPIAAGASRPTVKPIIE